MVSGVDRFIDEAQKVKILVRNIMAEVKSHVTYLTERNGKHTFTHMMST
jgi:hypothetical protein